MLAIAVDFGGTNIKLGLLRDGVVLRKSVLPACSAQGIGTRLPLVEKAVHALLEETGYALSDCACVGIAIPGLVDFDHCRVLDINEKYSDATDIDFPDWCGKTFNLPMVLENDARSAIVGEVRYGCCQGTKDAVLMSFGTGIGTAAVMDGKLLRGKHHQAGCLGGHIVVDCFGHDCNCGNKGCLEAQSGTWAMPRLAKGFEGFSESMLAGEPVIDYRSVMACAARHDAVSEKILDTLLLYWSAGAVNLIHAYDPEALILSGGLMKEKERILPFMEHYLKKYAWTPWGNVRICVAKDPDASVLLGLYGLCSDQFIT